MDAAFKTFYEAHHGGSPLDERAFDAAAVNYLSSVPRDWGKHDAFFNNFTPMWQVYLAAQNYGQACALWEWALRPVGMAETSSDSRFHKGSAYYFWGMSAILSGDTDRGYLLMHSALEEDIKTHGRVDPATPSYRLVVLDGQHPEQAFRPWVAALADSLDLRVGAYRNRTGRGLTIDDFRARFLADISVREAAFLLSFSLARLKRTHESFPQQRGTFASQLFANIMFDVCLVIDACIKNRSSSASWKFIDLAAELSSIAGLGVSKTELRLVNGQFGQNFEGALRHATLGTMNVGGHLLAGLASSLSVVYGLRNSGAHAPASVPFVAEYVDQLLTHALDVLFLCVETMY
jgi:hypothetical protein